MSKLPVNFRAVGKYIHAQYYEPGRKSPIKFSTGIEWDETFKPGPGDAWYRKPKHERARRLQQLADAVAQKKAELKFAKHFPHLVKQAEQETAKSYTFAQLAILYAEYKSSRNDPLDPDTLAGYRYAVELIEGFHAGARLSDLNKDFVKRFDKYIYTVGLKPSSLSQYITKLRTLVRYALSEEWITSNPLTAIKVKIPKRQAPVHDDFEVEIDYIRWAFPRKCDFVLHHLYERLTGFRAGDSAYVEWSHVDLRRGILSGYNEKLRRDEPWPIHNSLGLLLELAKLLYPESEYVFPLRSYKQIYNKQKTLWKDYRTAFPGTHNLKRNYALDIDESEPPQEVGKYLKHHAPDELNSRYVARPMKQMLAYSNKALDKFIPILNELLSTAKQPNAVQNLRKQAEKRNRDFSAPKRIALNPAPEQRF